MISVSNFLFIFFPKSSSSRINLSQGNIDSNISNSNLQLNLAGLNLGGQLDPNILQQQVIQQQVYQMQQRAFLASSLQQNLEIQKQLLQQNQQLQQLLAATVSTTPPPTTITGSDAPLNRSTSMSSLAYPLPPISPIFQMKSTSSIEQASTSISSKASESSEALETRKNIPGKISIVSPNTSTTNGLIKMIPPPPPPPPPPPLSPGTDVFGRAKTVRIGKWRWPPPSEGANANSNFIEFKRKKQIEKQDKIHNSNSDSSDSSNVQRSGGYAGDTVNELTQQTPQFNKDSKPESSDLKLGPTSNSSNSKIFESSAFTSQHKDVTRKYSDNTIVPGSIGKLRISSEMRAKLEQLTIDQSVRSSKRDRKDGGVTQSQSMDDLANMNSVKKLSEQRKALLERQLMGSLRNTATFMETASTPNIKQTVDIDIVTEHIHLHKKLSQENSINSNYEPSSHVKKFIKNQQNILRKSGSREFRERREELGPFNRLSSSSIHVNYSDRPLYTPDRYFHKEEAHNGVHSVETESHSAESSNNGRNSSSSGRYYNGNIACSNQNGFGKSKRMNIPPPPPPSDTSYLNDHHSMFLTSGNKSVTRHMPISRSQDRLSFDRLEFTNDGQDILKPVNGVDIEERQIKTKLYKKNEINFYAYLKPKFKLNLRKEVSSLSCISLMHLC